MAIREEARARLEAAQDRTIGILNGIVSSRFKAGEPEFPVSTMVKTPSGRSERLEIDKDKIVINDVGVKLVAERDSTTGLIDDLKLSRGTVALKAQFLEELLQQDLVDLPYAVTPKTDDGRIKVALEGINNLFHDRVMRPLQDRNIVDENGMARGVLTTDFQDKQGVKVHLDMTHGGELTIRRTERTRSKTMKLHLDENNQYSLSHDGQEMAKAVAADTLQGLFDALQSENDLRFKIAKGTSIPDVSSSVRAVEKSYVLSRDEDTIKRAAVQDAREELGLAPI